MGRFTDWLRAGFVSEAPKRTFSAEPLNDAPSNFEELFAELNGADGRVTRQVALSVPAVTRGRNLICSLATLPLVTRDAQMNKVETALLKQIDQRVPNVTVMAMTIEDLLFEAHSYWKVLDRDEFGYPIECMRIDPRNATVNPPINGGWQNLLPSGDDPRGYLWVEGKPIPWTSIIQFESPNPPFLLVGGRAVRLSRAYQEAARIYADDPRPMDYITSKNESYDPDDATLRAFFRKWKAARKRRSMAYIPSSFEYHEVQQPTPADLQLVEMKKAATLDIANFLGLDPEDLGVSTTSRTYQNAVDRRQDRINETFAPYMDAITDRLSMDDVTYPGRCVEFDPTEYLRADPLTRSQVQLAYHDAGVVTTEEIRHEERLPPLTPEQQTQTDQVNPVSTVPAANSQYNRPPTATFDRSLVEFESEPVSAAFSVDQERRTITGLAVPWGEFSSMNGGRRYRFLRGSVKFSAVNRVKLLEDHVNSSAVGKAIKIEDTDAGLLITFSVMPGPKGDAALAAAEHGTKDGLSVGVDFKESDLRLARDMPGGRDVVSSALREVSLTAMPSFDSSRLTSVRASDEGITMKCIKCGLVHADGVTECAPATTDATFSVSKEMWDEMQGKFAKPEVPVVPPAKTVTPRNTAITEVHEPVAYRFAAPDYSGMPVFSTDSQYDFAADLMEMAEAHDSLGRRTDAGKRVMGLIQAKFAVASGDVNELNPSIQTGDYVDRADQRTPIWTIVNKGAPPNGIQPFVRPSYSTSAGLVGPHTEGTEPDSGTYVTTAQTITPTANSGKASITREVWDQGGSPATSSLIWGEMIRDWYEGLEQAAATFLNTLTAAADITLTAGATTDAVFTGDWEAAIADLQFSRKYDFTAAVAERITYKRLAQAKTTTGEPIYPRLGPNNRNGQARGPFQAIDAGGVEVLPAWALISTAGSPNNSWLFDPRMVEGWSTAPQRLTFPGTDSSGEYAPVAYVDLAIWGYKAFNCRDISGVRQVIYDNAT